MNGATRRIDRDETRNRAEQCEAQGQPELVPAPSDLSRWTVLALESGPLADAGRRSGPACLSDDVVVAFVEGRLGERDVIRFDRHLDECPTCRALVLAALDVCSGRRAATSPATLRCWLLEPDTLLSQRYLIRRALGQGGMGDVYEAFDIVQQRSVALKTARATDCDRLDAAQLRREFDLASRVNHRNVRGVYDVGVHHDTRHPGTRLTFMSMELVEGESLARQTRRGPSVSEFSILAREILLGVAAIHQSGVIHCDLKSHNIILRSDEPASISIIDFGLAIDSRRASSTIPRRVESASIGGSVAYMAPEQLRCDRVSPATDVFGCGVVFFRTLAGILPFRAFGPERARGARRDAGEVPLCLRDVAPAIPVRLAAFVARCLELDPARRYPDAGSALDALRRVRA